MLEVQIENILPVTEARDKLNQLIDSVESSDNMYVMTKNGKPSAILVGVHHLEKLTGEKHDELFGNNISKTTPTLQPESRQGIVGNETEESMGTDPMNPVQDDAAATPVAGAPQTTPPADDATTSASSMPPVVSDSQSSMAGYVIPEEKEEEAPASASASPFAPAEPTVMPPAAPAPTDVTPAPSFTPSANATVGEEEKPADDADASSATPTPPPATPSV